MAKKRKALILFSGGLDSMLAAKILQEQKIKVMALIFKSFFWETNQAEKSAKKMGLSYLVYDFSKEHLEMVKNPKHGYGKAANPCIDCHALMLKEAKKVMEKEGFDFVATGEVLGERPLSQNKKALLLIAKESGLNDLLLRPLSAKLLPISKPEKLGWVDRKKLMAIEGRSRQPQMALARKFNLLKYPQPAGGCILCEKEFGKRLFNLIKQWPKATGDDITLLRIGRHFWEAKTLIVLGRNQEENKKLKKLKKEKDVSIIPENFPGPSALIRGKKIDPKIRKKTQKIILSYSKKAPNPFFSSS